MSAESNTHRQSWMDDLIRWMEHLPGRSSLFYPVGVLGGTLLVNAVFWNDGSLPCGQVDPEITAAEAAISGLVLERETYAKVSTWPLGASALRTLGSALLLPIVLWLIPRLLEQFL